MSLSHPHWKVSRTSASLVWEISKQLKVFSCFSLPNFDLFLFYLMERTALATYNILQANGVVFGWFFLINLRKKCHFWCCSISNSFVGICCIYLENSVLNFYFGFDIEKTIPVYIPTHLVISFIQNQPSFTKCSRVRICFILLLQKMVSQNVCCEKLIFYLNWNHQHNCKEFSYTEWSFTLQETSSNVVFRATTRLCRVKIYPRTCQGICSAFCSF